jgi:hypothetical protein
VDWVQAEETSSGRHLSTVTAPLTSAHSRCEPSLTVTLLSVSLVVSFHPYLAFTHLHPPSLHIMQKTASPAVLPTSRTSQAVAAAQPNKVELQQRLLAEAEAERQLKAVIVGEPSQDKATSTAEDEETVSLSLLHMDGLQPSEAVAFLTFKQGNGADMWSQWSDGMQRYRATRRECRQRLRSLHSERDAIATLASAVVASTAGVQTADGVEVMDEADYHRLVQLTARKRQWRQEEEERRRQEAELQQQEQSIRQLQLQLCTAFSSWYERWYGAGERERAEQRRRVARQQQQQQQEAVEACWKEEKTALTEQKEATEPSAATGGAAAASPPVQEEKQSAAGADDAKPGSAQLAVPSSASSLNLSDVSAASNSTTSTQRKVDGSTNRTKTASRSSARP